MKPESTFSQWMRAHYAAYLLKQQTTGGYCVEFLALKRRCGPTGYSVQLHFDGPRMLLTDWREQAGVYSHGSASPGWNPPPDWGGNDR